MPSKVSNEFSVIKGLFLHEGIIPEIKSRHLPFTFASFYLCTVHPILLHTKEVLFLVVRMFYGMDDTRYSKARSWMQANWATTLLHFIAVDSKKIYFLVE